MFTNTINFSFFVSKKKLHKIRLLKAIKLALKKLIN